MNKGRPMIQKVDFNVECFQQALDNKKISLRQLNTNPHFGYSERTLRRAKKEHKINPEILDQLGKFLDVDPLYLQGEYIERAKELSTTAAEEKELLDSLSVSKFPYSRKVKRDQDSLSHLKSILIDREIPWTDFEKLTLEKQIRLYIDIDRAIDRVIWNYFQRPSSEKIEYPFPNESKNIVENQSH